MKKKTEGREQGGFTIIEVLMFLAIGGALISLMVFAVYRMLDNSRFSDTINSATSFIQTQYEEARSSVRPDGVGVCDGGKESNGRSDCLLLGKAIVFREMNSRDGIKPGVSSYVSDAIQSYYVISSASYSLDTSKTDIDDLNNPDGGLKKASPHLTEVGSKNYALMYNAHYAVIEDKVGFPETGLLYRNNSASSDTVIADCVQSNNCGVNVILILRNPNSATLNTYAFYADLSVGDIIDAINRRIVDGQIFQIGTDESAYARNSSMAIPIVNGDSNSRSLGAVCIEQGSSSASIFGVRELGYYNNIGKRSMQEAIKILREKCESM